jgi:glutamate N-acetyltransferase/amino-acid N-acetyltransferase
MAVGLSSPEHIIPVEGVRLSSCRCGIKAGSDRDDLVMLELDDQANTAAVFTTNKFCAAPVTIARQHLQNDAKIKYLLINSGNANAGTGKQGLANALKNCQAVADHSGAQPQAVLPFSTGVIGQQLDADKINAAIPGLINGLKQDNWLAASIGIMTTDTVPKAISREIDIDGETITITGMCKGSGMIKPDMATLLAYVATDAVIARNELERILKQVVNVSFNCISVDGDTSTNDACVLVATGKSRVEVDSTNDHFIQALMDVFIVLAQSIIRDGEGATKFVEIQVEHAHSTSDARELAYTIAHSPLVKTALFASDANWGRILAAIGRADVKSLDISKVDLYLGQVCLIEQGLPHADYSEEKGQQEVSKEDIIIRVDMNAGEDSATVWTTDLSYDYVKINAEYRS